MDKSVKQTGNNLPGPGPGRPKGSSNKSTAQVKDMIMEALQKAGGVKYLTEQAKQNPKAFLTLVGRVLPLQVGGDPDNPLVVQVITRKIVKP